MPIKVKFLFVCTFLLLQENLNCEVLKSANNIDNNKNANKATTNATLIPITNPQIITTNSTELINKQMQDVEEKLKSNKKPNENNAALQKTNKNSSIESGEKLSRKITPTNNVNDKTAEESTKKKDAVPITENKNTTVAVTAKPALNKSEEDVKMVAENVTSVDNKVQGGNASNIVENPLNGSNKNNDKIENAQMTNPQVNKTASSNINHNNTVTKAFISTTSTTTPKPKPKKPLVAYGTGDIQEPKPEIHETKLSVEPPHAQPSQELNLNLSYRNGRDYIVPMMAIIFTIPLAIGIIITAYRRFKDFWSTRHYRRMDFLVDGMYND